MDKTVCELFAGVGGFRLGLSKAKGWKVVFANQWEPGKKTQYAFDCYTSHFKTGIHSNIDIADVKKKDIPKHTLLVGGFPCQDYSVARTKAEGIIGKKGVLWWQIERILKAKKPPFVLLENVDRLLKSPAKQRGRDFAIILGCLRDLGYGVEWRMINAADYGFPQRRRRVFIFAFRKSTRYHKNIMKVKSMHELIHAKGFFQDKFPILTTTPISLEDHCIKLDLKIIDISDNFEYEFGNAGIMLNDNVYTENVMPASEEQKPLSSILEEMVDEKYYISAEELPKWNYMKGSKSETRKTKEGYEYLYTEGAIPFPDPIDRPARTMLTSEGSKNRSTHVVNDLSSGKLRLLTPLECEKINGFDPNWTDTGMPPNFRYFCMGNALVVGLIERMGKTLNKIITNENSKTKKKL